ncbi:MAG: acyl-CoA dehydrogenase family protein [Betaproteobacteria bacterium]|nr:acyl-CoA dehydrogenase family protein [Betaproteobacteria bacterium]
MNFDYSEEQQLLADSVRRLLGKDYDFDTRRKIVASAEGWSESLWAKLAELGVLGFALPSEYGGFGGGAVDLMGAMEAMGEALVVEPFLPTVGLAARLVARGASDAQKQALLPAIADGRLRMAFAYGEKGARYNLARVESRAVRAGGGWRLDGEKCLVLGAPMAQKLIVSARTAGEAADEQGISLFVVDHAAQGLTLKSYRTLDEMRAADVVLKGVTVDAVALLGAEGGALPHIEEAVDFATALLCIEAVGALKQACDATLEYLKTRKQFGVPIGSFQALQHRMVDMVVATEQARSMACLACTRADSASDASERARAISAAKIRIADACRQVSQEAIQLHGGMGMSEEMKVSHTFRRLTAIAQQFGDAEHHLARFARLA